MNRTRHYSRLGQAGSAPRDSVHVEQALAYARGSDPSRALPLLDDDAAAALVLAFGLDLLGSHGLLHPIVGSLGLLFVLLLAVGKVGALADQQVFIGHRVVVFRVDLQGLVERGQAAVDDWTVLGLQF